MKASVWKERAMAVFKVTVEEKMLVEDKAEGFVPHGICAVNFEVWFHGLQIDTEEELEAFRLTVLSALEGIKSVPLNKNRPQLEGDITVDVIETAGRLKNIP
jgi:hypothetical protein